MIKNLRFFFIAIMAMVTGNIFAQEVTIDFDADYKTLFPTITGESSGSGANYKADGEFNENTTSTAVEGVTVTVFASDAEASTRNRIWASAPRLRLYNGSISFASSGKKITQMVMTIDTNNSAVSKNNTTDVGTLDFTDTSNHKNATLTWEGSANEVVMTIAGNTQFHKIVFTLSDGSTPTLTPTTIAFADGYLTKIATGPDGMFPEVGSSVALPTASVMAGDAAVEGAAIEWTSTVKSWKEGKPEPTIADGKVSFADGGYGELELKASFAGNDSYKASSKTYKLTIYSSYGKLSEIVKDIVDPKCENDDESDASGKPVFFFFREVDADGIPSVAYTVSYVNGKYIYLTDGEGNNLLFYGTNSQKLKAGDKISGNISDTNLGGFWGTLKRYNKLPELAFTDMNVKVESEGNVVEPTTITVDKLIDNINNLVKIENAIFASADGKNITFKVGETSFIAYNSFNLSAETIATLEEGATYTLTGLGSIYYKKGSEADPLYQLYLDSFIKTADPSSVTSLKADGTSNQPIYNLKGQRLEKAQKGINIVGDKKVMVK